MKDLGIQYFTMRDIDRLGIQRVMEVTFDHLLARYLSQIDIHIFYSCLQVYHTCKQGGVGGVDMQANSQGEIEPVAMGRQLRSPGAPYT